MKLYSTLTAYNGLIQTRDEDRLNSSRIARSLAIELRLVASGFKRQSASTWVVDRVSVIPASPHSSYTTKPRPYISALSYQPTWQ
jgi:hypothetical protein